MTTPIRRRVLLERNIWQGYRSTLPQWAEVLLASCPRVDHWPKRRFKTCAKDGCRTVFYSNLDLCRECRPQPERRK